MSKPEHFKEMDQGIGASDCYYCAILYPGLVPCPQCAGTNRHISAQMMSQQSVEKTLKRQIDQFIAADEGDRGDRLKSLLHDLHVYDSGLIFFGKDGRLHRDDLLKVWESNYGTPLPGNDVATLVTCLSDQDVMVRARAASALGGIGQGADDAVPALIAQLKDSNLMLRQMAASALGDIGPAASDAVPALIAAMKDSQYKMRGTAAMPIGGIGSAAAGVVPALIDLMQDAQEKVRMSAVLAMGRIKPAQMEVAPVIINAIENRKDAAVAIFAIEALGHLGPVTEDVLPVLIRIIEDEPQAEWFSIPAARALGMMGPAAKQAIAALSAAIGNDQDGTPILYQSYVRDEMTKALDQIKAGE